MSTTFAPSYVMIFSFRDAKGQVSRVKLLGSTAALYDDQNTLTGALLTDLQALSNAVIFQVTGTGGNASAYVQYGTPATYENVEDKAALFFQTAVGRRMRIEIPAPLSAIFLSDQETVNPTNTHVAALITTMTTGSGTAEVVDRGGAVVNNFVGGIRIRRKYQRRGNIYTLTPQLTPEIPEE